MTDSQKWFSLVLVFAIGVLFYLLGAVLLPFLVAAGLAYIGQPLVTRLIDWKLPRLFSVVIVFLLMFGLLIIALVLTVPLLEQQISLLIKNFPAYIDKFNSVILPGIASSLGIDSVNFGKINMPDLIEKGWKDAGKSISSILGLVGQSGIAFVGMLVTLMLIPVITFYFLRDWPILITRIHGLIPRYQEKTVVDLAKQSDQILGAFLRGQLIVMLCLGVIYSIGLSIAGLDLAILIGMIAGLLSFVPYLGFIIGFAAAAIAILVQVQSPEVSHVFYVFAVFGVGQALESFVLTPLLLGEKIGLHPVAVIFAILAGGQLFGFVGVLLALPVAAVIVVLLRHVQKQYMQSKYYHASDNSASE